MGTFNTGPSGLMLMVIGGLLAAASTWTAFGSPTWAESLPSIFIGLSLVAVGYSLMSRTRRERRRHRSE